MQNSRSPASARLALQQLDALDSVQSAVAVQRRMTSVPHMKDGVDEGQLVDDLHVTVSASTLQFGYWLPDVTSVSQQTSPFLQPDGSLHGTVPVSPIAGTSFPASSALVSVTSVASIVLVSPDCGASSTVTSAHGPSQTSMPSSPEISAQPARAKSTTKRARTIPSVARTRQTGPFVKSWAISPAPSACL